MLLTGCVVGRTVQIAQRGLLGSADLAFTGCVSKKGDATCSYGGNSNVFPTSTPGTQGQLLVAVRISNGSVLPSGFDVHEGTQVIHLAANQSYTDELARTTSSSTGIHWVGYISDPVSDLQGGESGVATMLVQRPPNADGSPLPARVIAGVTLGGRLVNDQAPATRPVVCDISDGTVCADWDSEFSGDLHDLQLAVPGSVTASAGGTAVIPVRAMFAGSTSPDYTFALSATTTLPGAAAVPNVPTLTPPGNSTTSLSVSVPVPAAAAPGTYEVVLTATVGAGETRTATARLVVPPAPATAGGGTALAGMGGGGTASPPARRPAVTVSAGRMRALDARVTGLPVRVITTTSAKVTITLTQTRLVKRAGRRTLRPVIVARRNLRVTPPSTLVRIAGAGLRAGRVTITVTGAGVTARSSTVLR
ncbi:MAG: hypothetical protein U0Y82_11065 [Thermoleophilia bacterium]